MNRTTKFNYLLGKNKKTRKDLAKLLNLNPGSIDKKINGSRTFNDKQINKILKFLNIKYEDLFI